MAISLSSIELSLARHEAGLTAARLVRQLHLPWHEREDLQHDLLIDLFIRLKQFDARRGTFGAFAVTVLAHRASLLAWRIRRDQRFRAPLSVDDPTPRGRHAIGDLVPESYGYLAWMGQPTDRFFAAERGLDLERALGRLADRDLTFCTRLVDRSPAEQAQDGHGSRAGLYRRLAEIRLQLTAHGLAGVA